MANKYCNLVATNKIKDEYTKINDGFAEVENDKNSLQQQITDNKNNLTAHKTGSSDHDDRYDTKSQVNAKDAALQQQITNNENDIEVKHANHLNSTSAHNSDDLVNGSSITGDKVSDAMNNLKDTVDNVIVGASNTSIGVFSVTDNINTNDYAVSISGITYFGGLKVNLSVFKKNTGESTLNINSLGAKSIKTQTMDGSKDALSGGELYGVVQLEYDGNDFILIGNEKEEYSTPQTTQQSITSFESDTKDAKVLCSIGGETLFNYADNGDNYSNWTDSHTDITVSADGITYTYGETTGYAVSNSLELPLKPSTQYTIIAMMIAENLANHMYFDGGGINDIPSASLGTTSGIKKLLVTTDATITNKRLILAHSNTAENTNATATVKILAILEGDHTNIDITEELPYGVGHSTVDLQTNTENLFPFDTVYQGLVETPDSNDSIIGYIKVKPNTNYGGKVFESTLGFDADDRLWLACARYVGEYNTATEYINNTTRANITVSGEQIILTDSDTNYLAVFSYTHITLNNKKNLYKKIMVTEGNAIPTTYQPHKSKTLQPNITLRSVPAISDKFRNAALVNGKLKALECAEHLQNVSDTQTISSHINVETGVNAKRWKLTENIVSTGLNWVANGADYINGAMDVHGYSRKQTIETNWDDASNIGYMALNDSDGCLYYITDTSTSDISNLFPITCDYRLPNPIITPLPNLPELWSYKEGRLIDNSHIKPKITYSTAQNDVAQSQGNTETLQKHENHLETNDGRLDTLENEVTNNINQETITLTNSSPVEHITAKQNGGIDAVVKGEMIVNLLGKDGDFGTDSNSDGLADGWLNLNTGQTATISNNEQRIVSPTSPAHGYWGISTTKGKANANDVIYARAEMKKVAGTNNIGIAVAIGSMSSNPSDFTATESFKKYSVLRTMTEAGDIRFWAYISKSVTSEVQDATIRKAFLVNLTNLFGAGNEPDQAWCDNNLSYVNGAQALLHPAVEVRRKNLFDKDNSENLIGYVVSSDGSISVNPTFITTHYIPVEPNENYISNRSTSNVAFYDVNRNLISGQAGSVSILTPSNCYFIRTYTNPSEIPLNQFQVEQGTTPTVYEPYQVGQIIFPTELAKIDTYQDKLTYKDGLAKVDRKVKRVVLDGSLDWTFSADFSGFKRINLSSTTLLFNNFVARSDIVTKYDNSIVLSGQPDVNFTEADQSILVSDRSFHISVADVDSGWGENYIPLSGERKPYFNGWQMNNGTFGTPYNNTGTKTWIPLGDTDNTRAVTTVPTTVSPTISEGTINHYELRYALAEPEIEEIQPIILGDGVNLVEGQNTLTVKSGVEYERAEPKYHTDGSYHINWDNLIVNPHLYNPLRFKVNTFICIIKIDEANIETDDTQNWDTHVDLHTFGNVRLSILEANYDTNATYYVLYEVLQEEYNCQVQSMDISYKENLREAFNETVEAVANNEQSISDLWITLLPLADKELAMSNIDLLTTETTADLKAKLNEIINIWKG